MNLIDVECFDELVILINSISDEKSKRILLSKAAEVYGYGGKAHIVSLTVTTYPTLNAGKIDSDNKELILSDRIRKEGGGRKSITEKFPGITDIIEQIIDGNTYGDPCKELHWVASTLSLRKISNILFEQHSISISYVKVAQLLDEMGYSKQINQKM
ncbi:MAG: ISAzo13 family transposase, partial [Firmicutes bacterium]|nr:ISAzo13 family transposase [Bacillota bacterium]